MSDSQRKPYPNGRAPRTYRDGEPVRAQAFVSRGFEELAAAHSEALNNAGALPDYDVVVIGSGYGAAMAAASFAGLSATSQSGPSVCVLERGDERLPGSFPDSFPLIAGETVLTPLRQQSQPDIAPVQSNEDDTNPSRQIGVRGGLYEVRAGTDVAAVLANGLGGGSLINAGVMLRPNDEIFNNKVWPKVLRASDGQRSDALDSYFTTSLKLLGASVSSVKDLSDYQDNTVEHAEINLKKFQALKSLSGGKDFGSVPITVNLGREHSVETVRTNPCIQCGDCATGCNYGAKKSLDTNLLAHAANHGATIYTGATVQRFDRDENGKYRVFIWHTGATLRKRMPRPIQITCSKLIVAAGTFGSTELLFRSQAMSAGRLRFSEKLGTRFSGNGDNIAAVTSQSVVANDVALPSEAPNKRKVGPTITGMIDQRRSGPAKGSVPIAIQELAIPAPMYRFFRMAVSYSRTVDLLSDKEQAKAPRVDHLLRWLPMDNVNTNIVAMMGADPRQGTFDYFRDPDSGIERFGLQWNQADLNGAPFLNKEQANQFYTGQNEALKQLANAKEGTRVFPNPLSKPLGTGLLDGFFDIPDGPHLTVHPLGGAPMGENVLTAVVDDCGRVFRRADHDQSAAESASSFYEGLVVLDGSIVPSPVGINPALTISALALRASQTHCKDWFDRENPLIDSDAPPYGLSPDSDATLERPVFRVMNPSRPTMQTRTKVQLTERLIGDATVYVNGNEVPVKLELSILSDGVDISELGSGEGGQISVVATKSSQDAPRLPLSSRLRIYETSEWNKYFDASTSLGLRIQEHAAGEKSTGATQWASQRIALNRNQEAFLSDHASFEATVSGAIELPVEINRPYLTRMRKGMWAWVVNRGLSDITVGGLKGSGKQFLKWVTDAFRLESGQLDASRSAKPATSWIKDALSAYPMLFAHVGRERRLNYRLQIETVIKSSGEGTLDMTELFQPGQVISGHKKLHYVPARSMLAMLTPSAKMRHAMRSKRTELANPWAQLMYIHIDSIPKKLRIKRDSVLKLDTGYFARSRLPLFRFVDQDNAIDAYADLGRFTFDLLRPSAIQHFFSFRAPAVHRPEYVHRLEGRAKWVRDDGGTWDSTPFVLDPDEYQVDSLIAHTRSLPVVNKDYAAAHNIPLYAALTEYKSERAGGVNREQPPVLMIHGFSASGTTFAHDALNPGLARHLCERGHHVWVLDMRSSCRAPSSRHPWQFEDMANYDIAVAVDTVKRLTKRKQIDVVAHCMGAAMLSMAMLNGDHKHLHASAGGQKLSGDVHETVRRVVLSQVGPYFNFSPVNRLRAYLLSYFLKFIPVEDYGFNPAKEGGGLGLDNVLSTLPYQHYEPFHLENPILRRSAYSRLRRRMDALYGQTFTLGNMSDAVLGRIDEFFGPLNVRTIEQTIWFAHRGQVTDSSGEGYIQTKRKLQERWNKPTLWVHGADNGLSDPASPLMTGSVFEQAGIGHQFDARVYAGYGHQDTIMGANNTAVFEDIRAHLERADRPSTESNH